MNWRPWRWLARVPELLAAPRLEPAEHAQRIIVIQRNIVLPSKLVVVAVVFYYLYFSRWTEFTATSRVVLDILQNWFGPYVLLNVAVATAFFVVRQFPSGTVQWIVFTVGLVDGLLLGGLTVLTGGFDSILYWVFPGMIVLNAFCIPLATPQLVLNLMLSGFFLGAGYLDLNIRETAFLSLPTPPARAERRNAPPLFPPEDIKPAHIARLKRHPDPWTQYFWKRFSPAVRQRLSEYDPTNSTNVENAELRGLLAQELSTILTRRIPISGDETPENPTEPYLLRLFVLWLLTLCCYGVQVLAARQRLAEEEQKEFIARTAQLHAAGRLSAEFAHQVKNPLAIINNAVFSLERALREGRDGVTAHIGIIQEEVNRVDQIITQIMGYAQLSEGRVEKLNVVEELNRALEQVFPPAVDSPVTIERQFGAEFPPLLMQRRHLSEVLVNLLQNAREALNGNGKVTVSARARPDYSIEIAVRDNGPGVPPERVGRVFEPYFTTKEKGTGLGLSIVKHNMELYGGSVQLESELGKGARFILVFPAKAPVRLSYQPEKAP
jgi:signal transduction histidine kinase